MGLDDAVPIGKVLPFRDEGIAFGLRLAVGLVLSSVFHGKKKFISSYNVSTFIPVVSEYLGRQE